MKNVIYIDYENKESFKLNMESEADFKEWMDGFEEYVNGSSVSLLTDKVFRNGNDEWRLVWNPISTY